MYDLMTTKRAKKMKITDFLLKFDQAKQELDEEKQALKNKAVIFSIFGSCIENGSDN